MPPCGVAGGSAVLQRKGRLSALDRPENAARRQPPFEQRASAILDRIRRLQDRVDAFAGLEPRLGELAAPNALVGFPDRLGALAAWDLGERRFDDLGRRRHVGRKRIEADCLDDPHQRERRRRLMRHIAPKR
jgi:hypothetical protein